METLLLIGLVLVIFFWLLKYLSLSFDIFSFFVMLFGGGYLVGFFRNLFELVSLQTQLFLLVVLVGGTLAYVIWMLVKKQRIFDFSDAELRWWSAPIIILMLMAFGFAYRAGDKYMDLALGIFLIALIIKRFGGQSRYKKSVHLVNEQEKRIIKGIKYMRAHNNEITNLMYRELVDISAAQATRDLDLLEEKGLVEQIGDAGRYVTYRLVI